MDQAGVPLPALGVEDPERRGPTRPAVAVVRDERLRALADDVPPEPDPRPTGELEPDAGRLVHRRGEAPAQARRIEHEHEGLRAPGERGQSMESIADARGRVRPGEAATRQIEDEQVHGPARE